MASPSYSRQQGTARTYKITATAAALIIGVLVSLGAVYGLNRYLGPSVTLRKRPAPCTIGRQPTKSP